MIQILIIDFANQLAAYEFDSNYEMVGEVLGEKFDILDLFAHELSIAPLSSFVGTVEADFDYDKVSKEDSSWFSSNDGINAINGLLDFLKQSPLPARTKPTARYARNFQKSGLFKFAIEELEQLREILMSAQLKSKAARFKLFVI